MSDAHPPKRDSRLHMLMSEDEMQTIDTWAAANGVTRSDALRRLVMMALDADELTGKVLDLATDHLAALLSRSTFAAELFNENRERGRNFERPARFATTALADSYQEAVALFTVVAVADDKLRQLRGGKAQAMTIRKARVFEEAKRRLGMLQQIMRSFDSESHSAALEAFLTWPVEDEAGQNNDADSKKRSG